MLISIITVIQKFARHFDVSLRKDFYLDSLDDLDTTSKYEDEFNTHLTRMPTMTDLSGYTLSLYTLPGYGTKINNTYPSPAKLTTSYSQLCITFLLLLTLWI